MKSLNFAKRNPNGLKTESTNKNKGSTLSGPLGSLTKLPPELLLRIIDELDDAALCDLGCTCRHFNSLIFPMLFDKRYITHYLPEGWISCSRAPRYTLRIIRCSLPTRKFSNIYHCFNKGLEHLEEIEEMHAIVTRMEELGEFRVFLSDPDDWAMSEAPGLDETQVPQLTSEEWTELYLGLLTAALAKGCINAVLGDGERLDYLLSREQTTATHGALTGAVLSLRERVLGSKTTRYFDGAFRYKSPFAGQPKRHLPVAQRVVPLPVEENKVPQAEVPEGKVDKHPTSPVIKERKKQSRWLKWVEFFSTKNENSLHAETAVSSTAGYDSNNSKAPSPGSNRGKAQGLNDCSQSKTFAPTSTRPPPKPKLQSLTLYSNIFLTSPSFLNWTNQALSWCASTLTHLELDCRETPSGIWCKFLSKLKLPSLVSFRIASGLFVEEANVQGSDILGFLSRHPGIQKLYLHGIQVSACLSATPDSWKRILPNLTEVTAHPIWISRLLRNKKQCPKLKEVILLTEYYTDMDDTFEYDAMDRALSEILPRSHNLDLIGFKFTCDHGDLDSWLQSHVEAGPNSIMSSFINTKHLQIDSAYFVRIINPASRLDLVAQVAGLFPNLDCLEFKEQPDVYQKTDHIPPLIQALRQHSPQVKQVKINEQDPIDIANFQSSSE